jgi:sugar lactone lactonase YvrE
LTPVNSGGSFTNAGQVMVSTFAGSGGVGSGNGAGTAASFSYPSGVVADASGNIYVADEGSNLIRKISPTGNVTTFAGSGEEGHQDGISTAASFHWPSGLAFDPQGNLIVSELGYPKIRKISPEGIVSTIAGSGEYGNDDGEALLASFQWPSGIAIDTAGNIYVADRLNYSIRKIGKDGMVTTMNLSSGMYPASVALDATGNIYATDQTHHKIQKISPQGDVNTLAGSGDEGFYDGAGTEASFRNPTGLTLDADGNVYVTELNNHSIRKINSAGIVSTLSGTGYQGFSDGMAKLAEFFGPSAVALDSHGNLYIADTYNQKIRKIIYEGFTIRPALPAGLRMDSLTGIISGTPTETTIATNYIIRANNATGSSTWIMNISTIAVVATIQSFSPVSAATGTTVTIKGSNFTGAATVRFGGIKSPSFNVVNDSTVLAVVGAGKSGSVSVTTLSGTAILAGFNFLPIPVPNITYPVGAKTYIVGTQIAPLTPANTGGAITGNGQVMVTTLAGNGYGGSTDGIGTEATLYKPTGVVTDLDGNVYVADQHEHRIRKITPEGVVTTLAGNGWNASVDGIGTAASFNGPTGITIDADGYLYVADREGLKIRKISPTGVVSTLAGSGTYGSTDGTGVAASFYWPTGVAVDAEKNVYVADQLNNKIRKITPNGEVNTLAGSGNSGTLDGTGTSASFTAPWGITLDSNKNIYVSDLLSHNIRKITPAGEVTTMAGSSTPGKMDGRGTSASFNWPHGVVTDASGNVYVADQENATIRIINDSGYVSTFAGSGKYGFSDSIGTMAQFAVVYSITVDYNGFIYVADGTRIRKITAPGGYFISPALPEGLSFNGSTGVLSGTPTISTPATDYTISAFNESGSSYWVVNMATEVVPPLVTSFSPDSAFEGSTVTILGAHFTGTTEVSFGGNPATTFNVENDTTIIATVGKGASGYIRVATVGGSDSLQGFKHIPVPAPNIIYPAETKIYFVGTPIDSLIPVNTGGEVKGKGQVMVTTLAGSDNEGDDDGLGAGAGFYQPNGVAVDAQGNLIVADMLNNKIRKITPEGLVNTVAGNGNSGSTDGAATTASFWNPSGVAIDSVGNIYVADDLNHKIRKINSEGMVSTYAGNGSEGSANGPALEASFNNPTGLAIDALGNLIVADYSNHKIRKITPGGIVSTLAGSGLQGSSNGGGSFARFFYPGSVAVDALNNVYVADRYNNMIRKINPAGNVSTLAGSLNSGSADGKGSAARFNWPTGIATDSTGNLYVADNGNLKIRQVSPKGVVTTLAGSGDYGSINDTGKLSSFHFPFGIGVGKNGTVYVADNHKIRQLTSLGGYFIHPALPDGLYLDAVTGVIRGTPTEATPATNYTISAVNATGRGTWVINITTIAPPFITAINFLTGPVDTTVIISGANLLGAAVTMAPGLNMPVVNNTNNSLSVKVPAGAISSTLKITTIGGSTNTSFFTIINEKNELKHQLGQTLTLTAPTYSNSYQWQVDMGGGFQNIVNNSFYSDATSYRFFIRNAPSNWSGYQYRVVMGNGTSSTPVTLRFFNHLLSGGNWSNPALWSSGNLPDQYTDIEMMGAGTLVIDTNAECKSLRLNSNQSLQVMPGIKFTIKQ